VKLPPAMAAICLRCVGARSYRHPVYLFNIEIIHEIQQHDQ